jgi:hypothetical protein
MVYRWFDAVPKPDKDMNYKLLKQCGYNDFVAKLLMGCNTEVIELFIKWQDSEFINFPTESVFTHYWQAIYDNLRELGFSEENARELRTWFDSELECYIDHENIEKEIEQWQI